MNRFARLVGPVLIAFASVLPAAANDTTFTYQGSLKDAGSPATGSYAMTFRLYAGPLGGSPLATVNAGTIAVDSGIFSVDLDFGAGHFDNSDRWLEVVVNGTTLSPRQPVHRAPYAITTRGLSVNSAGQVGIGGGATTTNMLTVRDQDAYVLLLSQGSDFGPKLTMRNTASGLSTIHGRVVFDDGAQLASIGYVKPLGSPPGLAFVGDVDTNLKITDAGLIGVGGELDPQSPLHVQREDLGLQTGHYAGYMDVVIEADDAGIGLYSAPIGSYGSAVNLGEVSGGSLVDTWSMGRTTSTSGAASSLFFKYGSDPNQSTNSTKLVISAGGDVGIGLSVPQAKLHVNGAARVDVLEIVGADLAERFPSVDPAALEPGMVVEIDPGNTGHLRLAQSAFSRLVAGVVSGANDLPAGTILGNLPGLADAPPVALSGRVWVRCDATDRAVEPGDLLTTSDTPGHAMSVGDRHGQAVGSIIGKAMTSLDRGESGLVLVLVGLQ